jgi:putative transposase
MLKTFKYRLYPTKRQITKFNTQLELCRWVYNKTLELRKNAIEQEHKSISLYDSNKFLILWTKEKLNLKNVYSQVLRDCQLRVDLAFKSFFRRIKNKQNPGYPRFKSFGRYDSFTYSQSGFNINTKWNTLYLSKTGHIPIVLHRPIQGRIKTCTIQKTQTDKWFVCFSCVVDQPEPLYKTNQIMGMDLGLKTYIQISDKKKIKNPRFFHKAQKDLAKVQRKLDKFPKGDRSPKRQKVKKSVAKIHEKIANRRADFCHKTALKLVQDYDFIAHENLNIKNMLEQKKFSKSIADASWAQLINFLTYKAAEAGKVTVAVNPQNTSQQCSRCGILVPKDITVRVHNCSHCGLAIDRDLNASYNILRLGLESVGTEKYHKRPLK